MALGRRHGARLVAAGLVALGIAAEGRAQGAGGPSWTRRLSLDAAGAWSASSLFGGVTGPGRGTLQLALHTHVPLVAGPRFRVDYTGGIVPVELAPGTRVERPGSLLGSMSASKTVYGAGLDGLGLTARFGEGGRLEPYLEAIVGMRLFTDPVPNPRGTRLNFSAHLGGGVAVRLAPGRRLRLGLALHHLSNGGLGSTNPSFNALGVTVGLERERAVAGAS